MTSSSLPEPILAQLGPILGPFGPQLGPLGTPRTLQKCMFSLSFCTFSAFHLFLFIFCSLELREAVLARSWAILGPSWALLGAILGPRWAHLGPILASWGLPGGLLGASLGLSGPSWGHPGHNVSQPYFLARLFHRSWALWGRFGALLGPSWDPFGALWGLSWASWGAPGPLLGFVWGPRGCIRGCMHSSPALFLSRWPGTSPFLYRRVYAKLCRTHFSRSLPHCLASSLQPLMQFILALSRHLSTATDLMKNLCFYYVFVHFGFRPFSLRLLRS